MSLAKLINRRHWLERHWLIIQTLLVFRSVIPMTKESLFGLLAVIQPRPIGIIRNTNAPRLSQNESDSAVSSHYPDQPRQFPEILNSSSFSKQLNEVNAQSSALREIRCRLLPRPVMWVRISSRHLRFPIKLCPPLALFSSAIVPVSSATLPPSVSELEQPVSLDPAPRVKSDLTAVDSKTDLSSFSSSKNVATANPAPVAYAETEQSMPSHRAERQPSDAPTPVISSYPTSMSQKMQTMSLLSIPIKALTPRFLTAQSRSYPR